jgi:isoleucyl-tRNA synthetase
MEVMKRWYNREGIPIRYDETSLVLEPDEILVLEEGIEPYAVASSNNLFVGINTHLSEELISEGIVRDLVRQVQNMRKEADLRVEERIQVGISADDSVSAALERYKDYFLTEVLGTDLAVKLEQPLHQKDVNLGGRKVLISIARA